MRTFSIEINLAKFLFGILWVAGIVIAKGFWSTFFAFIFPFWAYYLVIERVLIHFGIL
jgi:hypothetical protein